MEKLTQARSVILAVNIAEGKLSKEEAVFIALCVDHAIKNNVQEQIGSFGMQYLERATKERKAD